MNSLKRKSDLLDIISTFGRSKVDTGSPETQVAILTQEIKKIGDHLAVHKKDKHCVIDLKIKNSRRKALLQYLKRKNLSAYENIVSSLNLRINQSKQ